ncbi:MAG: hypothetical protein H6Q69_204 [Firmicutes bacterium]|nr:hypothetical protein [Bacillota bacterium]
MLKFINTIDKKNSCDEITFKNNDRRIIFKSNYSTTNNNINAQSKPPLEVREVTTWKNR